jgi:hypothetical protein
MGERAGGKISGGGGLEVCECFGEAAFLQVVAELRIDFILVCLVPCGDGFGDFAERVEVPGRIAVAPWVIGNDGLAAFEQIDERLMHARRIKHRAGLWPMRLLGKPALAGLA